MKFEYQLVILEPDAEEVHIMKTLNAWGNEGWEAIHFYGCGLFGEERKIIFKRSIPNG